MSGLAGRFLTKDQIGYSGSDWCLFEYVGGSVLNAMDPSGLATEKPCCHGVEYDPTNHCCDWIAAKPIAKRECSHCCMEYKKGKIITDAGFTVCCDGKWCACDTYVRPLTKSDWVLRGI
jgi:hypothetical protein